MQVLRRDIGQRNALDSEIMAFASANDYVVAELESGALLTVDPNRTRMRLLPLQRETDN